MMDSDIDVGINVDIDDMSLDMELCTFKGLLLNEVQTLHLS